MVAFCCPSHFLPTVFMIKIKLPFFPSLATGFLFLVGELAAQSPVPNQVSQQSEIINIDRAVDSKVETLAILRSEDKRQINRYVAKTYVLNHANPTELIPLLREAVELEEGSVGTAWIEEKDGSTRKWIQVNAPEFQLPYLDKLVEAYDQPGFRSVSGRVVYSYRTKYRDAVEVANFIQRTVVSPDGRVVGDPDSNTLFITETPSGFKRVFSQVLFYDVPSPQLAVEVQFVELTRIEDDQIGLDWDAWKQSLGGRIDFGYSDTEITPSGAGDETVRSLDALLSLDATVLSRFLNFVAERGGAKILARTTVNVANGNKGTLSSQTGLQRFINNPGDSTPPTNPLQEGIQLQLTPSIAMRTARLNVLLETTSPGGFTEEGGILLTTQSVEATLTSFDDQVQKLSGITRQSVATERKGIPLLKDVPGVWPLFATERKVLRKSEIIVFLRPRWSGAVLPDKDAMLTDGPKTAVFIDDILKLNPNLSIEDADKMLLEEVGGLQGNVEPQHPAKTQPELIQPRQ